MDNGILNVLNNGKSAAASHSNSWIGNKDLQKIDTLSFIVIIKVCTQRYSWCLG